MTGPRRFGSDSRAVSVAVTHVLTIGITTVLVTGLLIAAGGVLDTERDRAAREELKTIGDRIGSELASVERASTPGADERIVVETEHPSRVSGSGYTVRLEPGGGGTPCDVTRLDNASACLVLTATGMNEEVVVPVDVDRSSVNAGAVNGGDLRIVYESDGSNPTITIESDS
jgi:hypothetical protein